MPHKFQHIYSLCGPYTGTHFPPTSPASTPHLHWIGVPSDIFLNALKDWQLLCLALNMVCYNCPRPTLISLFISTWKANKMSKPLVDRILLLLSPLSICSNLRKFVGPHTETCMLHIDIVTKYGHCLSPFFEESVASPCKFQFDTYAKIIY